MSGPEDERTSLHAWGMDRSRIFQAARDQYIAERDLHVHYEDGVRRARQAVQGSQDDGECPYPGLAAFGAGQARWFFGRDGLTAELLLRLDERLITGEPLVVTAPSGAGKSSLLRAGLLPAIRRGALPVAGSADWPHVLITPTARPMAALSAHLARSTGLTLQEIRDAGSAAGVARLCSALGGAGDRGGRLVVVIDQLEELFTLGVGEREQHDFLDLLAELARAGPGGEDAPALVVYGLRSDFYTPCAGFPQLRDALQHGQVLVGPMTQDELREAILFPARAVGLEVEPGLIEVLLRDLGADLYANGAGAYEVGRLPYLAHALRATWQQRHGHTLTVDGYRATGGIHEAIANTAERLFNGLDASGQQATRTLFLRLVRIGDGMQDTRRQLSRTGLRDIGGDPAAIPAIIDAYTRGRLLTQRQDTIEITHEALLHAWPRLRQWIDTDRTGLQVHQELEQAALEWTGSHRDTGMLYRGLRLQAAQDWASRPRHDQPSPAASAFLAASTRHTRRSVRIRRSVIAVLSALALIASITAVVAFQQRATAQAQRRAAQEQQQVATARQLVAKAEAALDTDPRTALMLNVAAHRIHPDAETYASLQRAITTTPYAGQLTGVDSSVSSIAYSASGRYLAAGFGSGAIMLWDLRDPLRPHQVGRPFLFQGFFGTVTVGFSSGDSRLVTAGSSGAVTIWDLTDPEHPRKMGTPVAGDQNGEGGAWLSPDGTVLATSNKKNPGLQLWDLTEPARIRPLGPPLAVYPTQVSALAFSAGGTVIATSAGSTRAAPVELWDIRQRRVPRLLGRIVPKPSDVVSTLSFSADGKTLAVGGNLRGTGLWNVSNPASPRSARDPIRVEFFSKVRFSPHGTTLATTGNRDTGLLLWDTASLDFPRQTEQLIAGETDVTMAFSPDGRKVASGSTDGHITLWNLKRLGHPRAFGPPFVGQKGRYQEIYSLGMSRDGTMIATGGRDTTVALWDTADPARPRPLGTLTGHTGEGVDAVGFTPDGRLLATGDSNGTVILWDLTDRNHPRRLEPSLTGPTKIIRSIVFSADGKTLIVGGDNATIFWDVGDPTKPRRLAQVLDKEGVLGIWRVRDGRVLALVRGSGTRATPSAAAQPTITTSGSGGRSQTGSGGPLAGGPGDPNGSRLWNITDPEHPRQLGSALVGHNQEVVTAAMSPAGDLLVTGDAGGAAILWDLKDPAHARRLGDPLAPNGSISAINMVFAPSTDIMVTGGIDGNAYLWDLGNRILPRQLGTALADNLDAIGHMVFSSSGEILATAGSRGDVVLWDLKPTYDLRGHLDKTTCLVTNGGLNRDQWARYLSTLDYQDTCAH